MFNVSTMLGGAITKLKIQQNYEFFTPRKQHNELIEMKFGM